MSLSELTAHCSAAAEDLVERLEGSDYFGVRTILETDAYDTLVNCLTDALIETVEAR